MKQKSEFWKTPEAAAVAAALAVGLLVHLFGLVNILHNNDDIWQQPMGYGAGITSGRWLLTILGDFLMRCGFGYNLPVVNGVLFLVLVALCAGVIVSLLAIHSRGMAVLFGMLFAVFPSATSVLFFKYTTVYYGIALLLSVLAAWALQGRRFGLLISALCTALSLGIYQAYVPVTVTLLVLVLLMPYAALIPMPCIAAILFQVAYNMSGWRTFVKVVKHSPKSDIAVLLLTFFFTVVFDLVVAIAVGLSLACLLFMKRMADVSSVKEWDYVEDTQDKQGRLKPVPAHVMVFEITGPMFFGAADKIPHMDQETDKSVLILRMRAVPALDITALKGMRRLWEECRRKGIQVVFSHVNEQPMSVFKKSGLLDDVGEENFQPNIDAALARAVTLRDQMEEKQEA